MKITYRLWEPGQPVPTTWKAAPVCYGGTLGFVRTRVKCDMVQHKGKHIPVIIQLAGAKPTRFYV